MGLENVSEVIPSVDNRQTRDISELIVAHVYVLPVDLHTDSINTALDVCTA